MQSKDVGDSEYLQFSQYLQRQCGIVLGENKQYLVRSRLTPVVRRHQFSGLNELIHTVVNGHNYRLSEAVVDAMTTNETLWFRDSYPFELLTGTLFQQLSAANKKLRVWSAACSSGQEPYSIAISFLEYKQRHPGAFSGGIEIVATDLSSDILNAAKSGLYDDLSMARGLSATRRQQFFNHRPDGTYVVKEDVKKLVTFKRLNLLDAYHSMGTFDVIFCRNVLIYFSSDAKRSILQQIAACLRPNGIMFLGASESISGLGDYFNMHKCNPGLYYTKKSQ